MKLSGKIFWLMAFGTLCATPQSWARDEPEAVAACIDRFFAGMRAGDSAQVRQTLYDLDKVIFRTVQEKEGAAVLSESNIRKFLDAVGTPHDQVWDERLLGKDIRLDGALATVRTPYRFYHGDTFSHCGINVFQLLKTPDGWKIFQVTDTRRQDDCPE